MFPDRTNPITYRSRGEGCWSHFCVLGKGLACSSGQSSSDSEGESEEVCGEAPFPYLLCSQSLWAFCLGNSPWLHSQHFPTTWVEGLPRFLYGCSFCTCQNWTVFWCFLHLFCKHIKLLMGLLGFWDFALPKSNDPMTREDSLSLPYLASQILFSFFIFLATYLTRRSCLH